MQYSVHIVLLMHVPTPASEVSRAKWSKMRILASHWYSIICGLCLLGWRGGGFVYLSFVFHCRFSRWQRTDIPLCSLCKCLCGAVRVACVCNVRRQGCEKLGLFMRRRMGECVLRKTPATRVALIMQSLILLHPARTRSASGGQLFGQHLHTQPPE